MWLKPLFARTSKNAKSGLRKWLEVLPLPDGMNYVSVWNHLHIPLSLYIE
jgi:hypothetical protein